MTTNRRPGLSLTEVLVALFIMGIGTIAILTLFPLGALDMAAALKDDRTSQAATQADSYLRFYWQAYGPASPARDPFADAFSNPNANVPPAAQVAPAAVPPPTPDEPSYPVFVDPMRFYARDDIQKYWAGYDPGSTGPYQRLPRRNLNLVATTMPVANQGPLALRTCSLLDGMTFDAARGGAAGDGVTVEREYRYNWLWVLQQPRVAEAASASMTVVVFDKRTYQFVPDKSEYAHAGISFTPGSTVIPGVPQVNGVVLGRGTWVMDGTVDNTTVPPVRHAYFYRVLSATETTPGLFDLELDRPVRRLTGPNTAYPGTLVILAGVSEVFERPPLTP
ncbi:MAG: prepilin-type N-terminal cleavage/methylation domain-containing protein [Gemmataceae bacterium]|nr:prepilin-type N-terminal cleavage/methylation domain-containing protein [Gemmataceae bacterium]